MVDYRASRLRDRTKPSPTSPTPSIANVAGSAVSTTLADTVPANEASNGAIVVPTIASAGDRLVKPRLNAFGLASCAAVKMSDDSTSVSGGLLTFTVSPGPPNAPNAASENTPASTVVPVQPSPVLMQKLPSKCWI